LRSLFLSWKGVIRSWSEEAGMEYVMNCAVFEGEFEFVSVGVDNLDDLALADELAI
jgi:hypothetical protein